jgi:hypothetical protein
MTVNASEYAPRSSGTAASPAVVHTAAALPPPGRLELEGPIEREILLIVAATALMAAAFALFFAYLVAGPVLLGG